MAPRGGRGGGGGSISDSSSSSSCDNIYACTTQLHHIYGDRTASHFTKTELHGQLVLYIIWSLALIALFTQTLKTKARLLQAALLSYLCSFIFLTVRFGLIIAESDVPLGYRYESSVVILLQRLGIIFLFAAALAPDARKVVKIAFYIALGILLNLNITYLVIDFIISSKAVRNYEDDWNWRLTDRDFALAYTPYGLEQLTTNGASNLSPFYVESITYDIGSEDGWQKRRRRQVIIGVVADFVALVLALSLAVIAVIPRKTRQKTADMQPRTTLLLLAAFGLLLTTLFQVIIATHYVLHNWGIVSDEDRWMDWARTFDFNDNLVIQGGGGGFLQGYRTTVDGFPIIQALFEPLGVVLACAGMVFWWRGRSKGAVQAC